MRKIIPITILFTILLCACLFLAFVTIPAQAMQIYGQPAPWLTLSQRVQYSALLLWYDGLLTRPLDANGKEQSFTIEPGESVNSVANHLEVVGLIRDAEAFRAYLIYSGLDTSIQAGEYKLSAAMSAIEIAHELQDATSMEVRFVVLPGWRMEEIAASLPTSGLSITPEEFLSAAQPPPGGFDFFAGENSVEGFLYPGSYIFSRTLSAEDLVTELVRNFALRLSPDLRNGFNRQGLTVYQAVTLASIVQREAVREEEATLIASVFLNRYKIGMKLDADPTVQYAVGFNSLQNTWWTNPISAGNLQFDSPYNTYLYAGLPPTPISNPGLTALNAVAFPAETPYYYFRAKCDGSGLHSFAETFEGHLGNACQ
jgi:UPF0755 protein